MRPDDIIDRQRIRRKLTFWRIASIILAVVAVLMVGTMVGGGDNLGARSSDHIARVKIEGTIVEDEELLERLEAIEESDSVKGVIISIDSPGGTTVGGEAIYEAVRKIADKKPVVAQVGSLAASAGYMIASASDHIVARQSSIVGSIGVIFQYPNFEQLLTNIGVDIRSIKSSPLKAEPAIYGETPPEAEEMIESMILDSFDWFKGLVAERRGFDEAKLNQIADGSIFTGRQALDNGLVDKLGGQDVARAWLTEQGLDDALEVIEWEKKRTTTSLFLPNAVSAWIAQQLGLNIDVNPVSMRLYEQLMLDGLLSVWHVKDQ